MGAMDDVMMPSHVREREDRWPLWKAFRRHVGMAWTGQRERDFKAGWDAALKHTRELEGKDDRA